MEQPVVRTRQGQVSGTETDGVAAFRGIPYAASPAGGLRFRPPRPHPGWAGVRDGTRPGPSAPQGRSRLEAIMGPREPDWDEDGCLNLNVWTPAPAPALAEGAPPRPVLLWFHGGAWSSGSGGWDWYDGARLAAAGDIVVVTANYRLGPLGYLWLDHGDPEPGGPEAADNLGSRDQAAALEWVAGNIAAFGGDAGSITVGGQSAGAHAALALALDPATSGLVRRVILQSGPWGTPPRQPEEAAEITRALAGVLDTDPGNLAEVLRRMPARNLLAAVGRLAAERATPANPAPLLQPVLGGAGLPRPWPEALRDGGLRGKQVLIGSTSHEMTAFLGPDTAETAALQARATEEVFGITAITDVCAEQGIPAYAYRFTRASAVDPALGAPHCAELPFVFGTLGAFAGARMLGPVGPADRDLAREMTAAFASFAATGTPAGDRWPAHFGG